MILVPQPGMEPVPPAVEAQSLNHWTIKEVHFSMLVESISPNLLQPASLGMFGWGHVLVPDPVVKQTGSQVNGKKISTWYKFKQGLCLKGICALRPNVEGKQTRWKKKNPKMFLGNIGTVKHDGFVWWVFWAGRARMANRFQPKNQHQLICECCFWAVLERILGSGLCPEGRGAGIGQQCEWRRDYQHTCYPDTDLQMLGEGEEWRTHRCLEWANYK